MPWQDECRARGGAVTVVPKGVLPGDPYIPACRISNGDGTSNYVDMRSWDETASDNLAIAEDNWNILLGQAITVRDAVVNDVGSVLKWSFTSLALAGAIGIALFKAISEKKR